MVSHCKVRRGEFELQMGSRGIISNSLNMLSDKSDPQAELRMDFTIQSPLCNSNPVGINHSECSNGTFST